MNISIYVYFLLTLKDQRPDLTAREQVYEREEEEEEEGEGKATTKKKEEESLTVIGKGFISHSRFSL